MSVYERPPPFIAQRVGLDHVSSRISTTPNWTSHRPNGLPGQTCAIHPGAIRLQGHGLAGGLLSREGSGEKGARPPSSAPRGRAIPRGRVAAVIGVDPGPHTARIERPALTLSPSHTAMITSSHSGMTTSTCEPNRI